MGIPSFNVFSICSGGGGLDLGLELAVPAARTVAYVEIEAYACEVLATRMEAQHLAPAPVWSNLKTFDGRRLRGLVDCVIGGYPCQPFSVAGRQRGTADPRHLWPYIGGRPIERERESNLVEDLGRPEWLFFENVANHLQIGFSDVVGDLQGMGYRVAAGLFTAEEIGATHKRERLFILAHGKRAQRWPTDEGRGCTGEGYDESRETSGGPWICSEGVAHSDGKYDNGTGSKRSRRWPEPADGSFPVEHPEGQRCGEGWTEPEFRCGRDTVARAGGTNVGYADEQGQEGRGESERSMSDQRPTFPPGPTQLDRWLTILDVEPILAPALSKEAIESYLRGMADGMAPRLDRLRLLGNGVVPLQAAYAFATLREALA